jgi:hypothetical protein
MHSVSLYDVTGRLVLAQVQPALRHTISLEGIGSGVYFVETWTEHGETSYSRLIVE